VPACDFTPFGLVVFAIDAKAAKGSPFVNGRRRVVVVGATSFPHAKRWPFFAFDVSAVRQEQPTCQID